MQGTITKDTMLATMTAGQLIDFLADHEKSNGSGRITETAEIPGAPRYVFGLRGIMELFNCCQVTAQHYKNGIIKDAVKQNGRKIITDADMALKLFNAARSTGAVND